ncbi:hypothetical protein RUMHYD_02273 [Blautia hydrogenotrophica DSM 10507]|uniref:Uncharacterized protein n=1 Tax=Blautia hydrogenotrophica (strain DSM 10507 / JCM 14656 / S5a33) TaxID=476272 RepID=C0CN35_BLAHS|nr:hypothetical protein RUMHYD_02273 [Blautia hydrogenotrophica DSM 10507]
MRRYKLLWLNSYENVQKKMSICRQYRRKARTVRRQVWGKFRSWTGE